MTVAFTIIGGLLAAALTAVLAHRFTSRRDLSNRRSQMRIQYLLTAYRNVADTAFRDLEGSHQDARAFEEGLSDIQLLGSRPQAEMARHIALQMGSAGEADLDDLLLSLRNELREVLGLERLQGNPVHTRVVLRGESREGEFPVERAEALRGSSPISAQAGQAEP